MTLLEIDHGRDLKAAPPAVGDMVMLRSGGPAMTVTAIEPHGDLTGWPICIWYDVNSKVQLRAFKAETLLPLKLRRDDAGLEGYRRGSHLQPMDA